MLAVLSTASSAWALDTEVTANTAAQAYELRSPFGDPLLSRRRVTQTLGLGVYDIVGDSEHPEAPQLFLKLRMRFDADFGIQDSETTYNRGDPNSRFVPGLSQAPLDLMYGYLEGKNLLGGWFGFRAGRQYVTDALGWWSFDGGMARLTAPYVHVEAYGGYEQRAGLPLSTGRFERDGVWRGDRNPLTGQADVFPMFQQAQMAPAYGIGLESAGPTWIHGRFDYRKVMNTGETTTRPFVDSTGQIATTTGGTRTSSERIGYAMDVTAGEYAAAKAGVVYDLYNALFGSYYGTVDAFVTQRVTVSADYDYYRPTFDGDSIWNWFTHGPITTGTLRAGWNVTDALDVSASAGIRWWETDDDPTAIVTANTRPPPGPGIDPYRAQDPNGTALSDPEASNPTRTKDWLGSAYGRYRWETGRAGLRGVLETGDRGKREGVDVNAEKYFEGKTYMIEGRGSVFDWTDEIRPDRSATSFGYVLGGGWQPADYAQVVLEWEHNMNRLVGQRYRVLALLNVQVIK